MPTLTAPTKPLIGLPFSMRALCIRLTAWYMATNAPVMEAVRVPPSACSTSQSSVIVRSPSIRMSTTVRRERPINRWISCVRPPIRPVLASRWPRSCVERGSIEYSAVTQPWPEPRRCAGTRSSTVAVIQTRVRPVSIRQEPSACTLTPSSSVVGRSSSGRSRPSGLGTLSAAGELEEERGALPEEHERDEDQQGCQRVCARSHEVGQDAKPDHPVGPRLVQPPGADDAKPSQRIEDDRQLEHQAEGQSDEQDEAEQLVTVGKISQVGRSKAGQHFHDQLERVEREADTDQEEEAGRPNQGQDQPLLMDVQARADEPPELPEDDRRCPDQTDDKCDLEPDHEGASRRQEDESGLLETRAVDQELEDLPPEDEGHDRDRQPADQCDDQRPPEILQVLDDGHAGFRVPRRRAAPAPDQKGHRKPVSSFSRLRSSRARWPSGPWDSTPAR